LEAVLTLESKNLLDIKQWQAVPNLEAAVLGKRKRLLSVLDTTHL
jgi:hypothetical protein